MPIFGAVGIGVLIFVLSHMAPPVLTQGETTVISVLHAIEVAATTSTSLTASVAGSSPLFAPPTLPQAPQIRP